MNSIESILGMIATEAIEGVEVKPEIIDYLPPIKFNLELIELPDGKYEWVEDNYTNEQ